MKLYILKQQAEYLRQSEDGFVPVGLNKASVYAELAQAKAVCKLAREAGCEQVRVVGLELAEFEL